MPRIESPTPAILDEAARILRAGGAVAFPTETVYGLGALTFNNRALDLVYELKGRPAHNPLIAHVLDAQQTQTVVEPGGWDERCDRLAKLYWPGPLTLVLPRAKDVPDRATAGLPTIAVRAPAHPVARALIECAGEGICAPSANRSGRVSPTTPQHVREEFADVDLQAAHDLLILDGGPCALGIESTVLDMTPALPQVPRVLRHGSVTLEQLREALGEVEAPEIAAQAASPGTSLAHYAPRTPAELVQWHALPREMERLAQFGIQCAVLCFDEGQVRLPHRAIVMPEDAEEYARALYDSLRRADALGCDRILIEVPRESSHVWRAIRDRLKRATAHNTE